MNIASEMELLKTLAWESSVVAWIGVGIMALWFSIKSWGHNESTKALTYQAMRDMKRQGI
jgi:hypothetical protein